MDELLEYVKSLIVIEEDKVAHSMKNCFEFVAFVTLEISLQLESPQET